MDYQSKLEKTAAQWLVWKDCGKFTPEEQEEFDTWLALDIRHKIAFAKVEGSWTRANIFRRIKPLQGDPDPDVLNDRNHCPPPLTVSAPVKTPPRKSIRLPLIAAVAALVFVLPVVVWYVAEQLSWDRYATSVGGIAHFPLPDGTTVQLNTNSVLRVRMTHRNREFRLDRGEAMIKAARDGKRPFRLEAGGTVILTEGAEFDVRRRTDGNVDLLVTVGRVATETIRSPFDFGSVNAAPGQSTLSAGSFASVTPGTIQVAGLGADEVARKTAWLRSLLIFRGETLQEVADEFNRYNLRHIEIADPRIVDKQIGGTFVATDPESFAAAVTFLWGLQATTVGGEEGPGYGTIRLVQAQRKKR